MVKLFVGNIAEGVSDSEMRGMFEVYGKVSECDVIGNYGFVHMEDEKEADEAIKNMNKRPVRGQNLHVELGKSKGGKRDRGGGSSGNSFGGGRGGRGGMNRGGGMNRNHDSNAMKAQRRAGCIKLHVANLPEGLRSQDLQFLFERYGFVAECDILADKKIAFVHIESSGAEEAINALNGRNFHGQPLKVQMSKNQNNNMDMFPPVPRGGFRGGGRGGFQGMRGRGRGMGMGGGFGGPGRGFGGGGAGSSLLAAGGYFGGNGGGGDAFGGDGFGDIDGQYDDAASALPPLAKDRMELIELLDRRRRLEALDPYEVELIQCTDPFNLPPPPPEYLRLLRERAMVKARLPLPPSSSLLDRSRSSQSSSSIGSPSSSVTRALIARRAAAVAASAREKLRNAALEAESYAEDQKNGADEFSMFGAGLGGMGY